MCKAAQRSLARVGDVVSKSVWSLGYCRLAFLALSSSHFGPKAARATASDYAISAADDVIARRTPLSDARCGFRKKIERSPPIGHVGLDLALRRAAECNGSAGYGVNDCCSRSRRVGRHRAVASVGIADVLERPRVIVPLQTATRDFRELE